MNFTLVKHVLELGMLSSFGMENHVDRIFVVSVTLKNELFIDPCNCLTLYYLQVNKADCGQANDLEIGSLVQDVVDMVVRIEDHIEVV